MQTYIAHYISPAAADVRGTGLFEFESDSRANTKGNLRDARLKMLELYGKDGSLLFQQELDYDYQSVEIEAGQILLYNRTGFCVYSTDGVEKFRGELKNVIVDQLLGIGRNRFALITEEGLYRVQLK
jgi:hypothetical protein